MKLATTIEVTSQVPGDLSGMSAEGTMTSSIYREGEGYDADNKATHRFELEFGKNNLAARFYRDNQLIWELYQNVLEEDLEGDEEVDWFAHITENLDNQPSPKREFLLYVLNFLMAHYTAELSYAASLNSFDVVTLKEDEEGSADSIWVVEIGPSHSTRVIQAATSELENWPQIALHLGFPQS